MRYNKHVIKGHDQREKEVDTMAEKMTIKQGFEKARALYEQMGDAEMVAFFDKRIEQTVKKSSGEKKPTARQKENDVIKHDLLNCMEVDTVYTIADMLTKFDCFPADMTPQRLSALLSQLGAKGTGEVKRTEEKGRAYFSLA